MYQISDSDSKDSDEGIRFKTDSIRYKSDKNRRRSRSRSKNRDSAPLKRSKKVKKHRKKTRRSTSSSSDDSINYKRDHRQHEEKKSKNVDDYDEKKNSSKTDAPQISLPKIEFKSSRETTSTFGPKLPPRLQDKPKIDSDPGLQSPSDSQLDDEEAHCIGPQIPADFQSIDKEQEEACIGPQLPPHLRDKINKNDDNSGTSQLNSCGASTSTFGPLLPPDLQDKPRIDSNPGLQSPSNSQLDDEEAHCIGPQIPADFQSIDKEPEEACIGPQLPPHLRDKFNKNDDNSGTSQLNSREASTSTFGPSLPPQEDKNKTESNRCIGPQLPPHLRDKLTQQDQDDNDDDDDEIYGPLPVDAKLTTSARIALEERALKLKMDQLEPNENQIVAREEWMLELPDVKAVHLGLGPRQFRKKDGPDLSDRSSWTDTPHTKKQQQPEKPEIDLRKQAELMEIQRRDKEQEAMSKKHKKSDKQSLLDMHQEKLKKAKQESGGLSSERRPFNREIDLQVNRFDEAQKKVVLKKAQLLDDRFARGQSKFL